MKVPRETLRNVIWHIGRDGGLALIVMGFVTDSIYPVAAGIYLCGFTLLWACPSSPHLLGRGGIKIRGRRWP